MQKKLKWLGTMIVICASSSVLSVYAQTSQKINLYFNERVPYLESRGQGRVEGLTATPANKALEAAGISYQWKKATAEQQIAVINRNQEQACLVGWFKRPEREMLGKYSSPIYAGKQMVALGLAENSAMQEKMRVGDLLKDPNLIMLVKEGYSYGQILDQQIRNFAPKVVTATGENINMLSMLVYKRADYFLVSEEEANALIKRADRPAKGFKLTYFAEAIKEDPRHFWCTKQVPDDVIVKLNRVLEKSIAAGTRRTSSASRNH